VPTATDRYTIISSDTHAGGSHAMYREFLDPKYYDDFDAWRGEYKNPFKDLGDQRRFRNWDNEMRNGQQDEDGVVGEVIFPNTVPPFFPGFVLFATPPKPEEYEHRLEGIRTHNRWLEDFCNQYPERRAGIGQIFVNDIDDAIEDVKWCKEHNLRGGVLLPPNPPDATWLKPYNHPDFDRLWAVCEDLEVPVNCHGGVGGPSYLRHPSSALIQIAELGHYSRRPFIFMLLAGVFERFPKLKFVMTEQGCSWLPSFLAQLDHQLAAVKKAGAIGELRFKPDQVLQKSATEYFQQNVWMGISFPGPADARAAKNILGVDKVMWGSDYPHDEGTYPFSRECIRQVFHDWSVEDMDKILTTNAAKLYNFDVPSLSPLAEKFGPTVAELSKPLDGIPDNANEALRRAGASMPTD
jgi:predicted TIM-barrel fold metal-dependent hydrolase